MTQPWEFMGYQKLASSTSNVSFANIYGQYSSSSNAMSWKLVMECATLNTSDTREGGSTYYYLAPSNQNSSSWSIVDYSNYASNRLNGQTQSWGVNSSNVNQKGAFGQTTQWANPQGSASNFKRYSTADDDLQWSRHDVHYGKQLNAQPTMMMQSFNTLSISNTTLYTNCCISTTAFSGNANSSTYFYIKADNYHWAPGSKFWLWGLRTGNDY
jgi:hypothetical protein